MATTTLDEIGAAGKNSEAHQLDLVSVDGEGSKSARRWTRTLLVLLLGVLLRGCVVCYAATHLARQWFYSRGLEMGLLADSLVHGHGLSSPFGVVATGPTAMIAPGYPLVVACIFKSFGSYSFASLAAILTLHVVLNGVTLWLILDLGRRVAGERAAMIASVFWAISPPLLWMPTIFWETSFSACLLLGSVWLALHVARRRGFAGYGVYCGVAGLMNPALLPSLLGIGLICVWRAETRRAQRLAVLLLSFSMVYAPWPLRNAHVFHAWIPTRTTVGFELWMGNRAGSSGYLEEALFPTYNAAELAQYKAEGEVKYFQTKQALAMTAIRRDPGQFLHLTLARVWRFWSGSGTRRGSIFFTLHAMCTTLLGGVGLWAMLRSGERRLLWLLLVPVLLFPLPYYVTHAEFRYRLNVDPVMTVLAAAGLARCLHPGVRARA